MAHEYTSWAYAQEIPGAGRKFVLVALADRANADGYSFPGQKSLASMTGQSERTVREHLEWLEAEGYVRREERRRKDGTRTSDAYYLPPMDSTGEIRRLSATGKIRRLSEATKPPVLDAQYPPEATGENLRLSAPRSTGRLRTGHRQNSPVDAKPTFDPSSTTQTPRHQPADFAGHESLNHQKEPPPTTSTQNPVTEDPRHAEEAEARSREAHQRKPLDLPPNAAAVMAQGPARGQTDSHLPTLHPQTFKQLVTFRKLHGTKATDEMFRTWSRQVFIDIREHDEQTVNAALETTIGNFATLNYPWSFYRACLNQTPRAPAASTDTPPPALDTNELDRLIANAKEGTL